MNTKFIPACFSLALLLLLLLGLAPALHADPPGPPPGAPGDTMKTLQEIWDKMEALEAQNAALQQQLNAVNATPGSGFPIEFVDVLNAGNAADTTGDPNPAGAVSYAYRIGKYEVTNAQYAVFLNAVAATDTNLLYDSNMGSIASGGITQSGASPNFTYAAKPAMSDKPVNYVNWYDCLRFCNWLHNGQPTGAQGAATTEGGAYTLTGPTTITLPGSHPTHGANGRNAGALFHLPGEDEWYKAAYHHPAAQGGDASNYWLYPTKSNGTPTVATADATGNIDNDTANIANHSSGADWNGQDGNVTTVGSGGPGSESFYGAADMGGNIYEWTEQADGSGGRVVRGGDWSNNSSSNLQSSFRFYFSPSLKFSNVGFRVAGP